MNNIDTLFTAVSANDFAFVIKIGFLIFIGLLSIFSIILFNQVRSLNHVVTIAGGNASLLVFLAALFYVVATIFLFLLTLVIL